MQSRLTQWTGLPFVWERYNSSTTRLYSFVNVVGVYILTSNGNNQTETWGKILLQISPVVYVRNVVSPFVKDKMFCHYQRSAICNDIIQQSYKMLIMSLCPSCPLVGRLNVTLQRYHVRGQGDILPMIIFISWCQTVCSTPASNLPPNHLHFEKAYITSAYYWEL